MSALNISMIVALLLVCGGAFSEGRWPEKTVAAALLANFVVNWTPVALFQLAWASSPMLSADASLVLDMALLAALLAIATSARPIWTMFGAAFQLLATLVSFVRFSSDDFALTAYVTAQNTFWWLTLTALAYGVWSARTSEKSGRLDPFWSPSSADG